MTRTLIGFVNINEALRVRCRRTADGNGLSIYALWDPRDYGIRYIGVTNKALKKRLARHLKEPTNAEMRRWFESLHFDVREPKIDLLEYVRHDEWEDAERGWIRWCQLRGQLLNIDRGGLARNGIGGMRQFVEGMYQPPTDSQEGPKRPVAVGRPGARQERPDPGLVPVAKGVFRRAG